MERKTPGELHQKLLIDISGDFDVTGSEYEVFKLKIKDALGGAGALGQCKSLFDIFAKLARRGKLGVGNYDILKQAFKGSNEDIITIIEQAEKAIDTVSAQELNTVTNSGEKRPREEAPEVRGRPKAVKEDIDPSDGKLSYYETDRKKGFLLVLNFEEDRNFTEYDVSNLKQFFEEELRFDFDSPRDLWSDDFTTQEVMERLRFVQNKLSDDYIAKKYYCFICVIMSHGKQGVFNTKDGEVKIDDVRRMFSNNNIKKFAGKPKIFFIQACQGGGIQGAVETNDESDDEIRKRDVTPVIDESDQLIRIPNDADVLLAYATTPGNRAYRRRGEGSWFIKECVSTFREFYQTCDLENMMTTVRERVALNWERTDRGKQMPYTWSTLTKRLRLRRSQI